MAYKPHEVLLLFTPHPSYPFAWTAHCSCGWKLRGIKQYVQLQHEMHATGERWAEKEHKKKLDAKLYERKKRHEPTNPELRTVRASGDREA